MNKITLSIIATLLLILMMAESLQSQVCWKTFDPENCQYRVITEFGISKRVNPLLYEYNSGNGTGINIDLNFGMDYKVREKIGLGGVVFADFDQLFSISLYGIRPRISYFPNNNWDLNFSTGMIFATNNYNYQSGGIRVETGATYKNFVGLYSRVDFFDLAYGQRETFFNLGLKTAGPTGLLSAGGCVVLGSVGVGVLVVYLFLLALGA